MRRTVLLEKIATLLKHAAEGAPTNHVVDTPNPAPQGLAKATGPTFLKNVGTNMARSAAATVTASGKKQGTVSTVPAKAGLPGVVLAGTATPILQKPLQRAA